MAFDAKNKIGRQLEYNKHDTNEALNCWDEMEMKYDKYSIFGIKNKDVYVTLIGTIYLTSTITSLNKSYKFINQS